MDVFELACFVGGSIFSYEAGAALAKERYLEAFGFLCLALALFCPVLVS